MHVISFEPIIHESCRVLVLGSMPGVVSLARHQYYGHPRNHFWPILYGLNDATPSPHYEERMEYALSQGIALWDVLGACNREGSLDASIQQPEPNDIKGLLAQYPSIHHLLFNGRKAYDMYRRFIAPTMEEYQTALALHALPSTSPAYTISLTEKLEQWANVLRPIVHTHK